MNQKEKKREQQELEQAVRVLRATLRSIAHRKARRYEQEFLLRVRDMIDEEIGDQAEVNQYSADYLAREVRKETTKDLIPSGVRVCQKNSLAQLTHDVARLFASHAYAVLLAYVLHHVQQLVGNSVDSAREVTRPSHGHHALAPSHVGVCQPPVLAVLGKVSPCLQ